MKNFCGILKAPVPLEKGTLIKRKQAFLRHLKCCNFRHSLVLKCKVAYFKAILYWLYTCNEGYLRKNKTPTLVLSPHASNEMYG